MNLLSPASLLWLLPIGAAITLLYMLRLKRRDVVVPTVMFWQAAVLDTQANAPFQKLRKNLLLALQLLVVALVALALSRPFWWASSLGGKTTALVLDASASMNATDEPGGRFAAAVRQAEGMIRRKGRGDAVALVLAAEKPILLASLTPDSERLLTALRRAHPTDASGDMQEAIQFAASLVQSRAGAQVTLLSDGAYGRLEELRLGDAQLSQVTIGQRANNIGITAFDVRDPIGAGGEHQAFVTVQNFGKQTQTMPLELRAGSDLVDAHEITLAPGESRSETFDHLRVPDTGAIVSARLDTKDDLAADNEAFAAVPPRRQRKILLVSAGNPFLERVLNTDTDVTLDRVSPATYKQEDSEAHDMTVFDAVVPSRPLAPGRYLFWGGRPPAGKAGADSPFPVTSTGPEAPTPQIVDWSRSHSLMRFVDLANVQLRATQSVAPTAWGQILAETDAGPLIVAGERGATRAIYVGFAVVDSDMPLRIAFPIFLSNSVGWLTARPGEAGGLTRPGDVIPLAVPAARGALTITRPDGGRDTLPVPASTNIALYDRADRIGVYTATDSGDYRRSLAVSLLSPTESNTAPVAKPAFVIADAPQQEDGANAAARATASPRARREIWPYIALAALVLLAAEWLVYHRRVG